MLVQADRSSEQDEAETDKAGEADGMRTDTGRMDQTDDGPDDRMDNRMDNGLDNRLDNGPEVAEAGAPLTSPPFGI
jgi:hypothetical protein